MVLRKLVVVENVAVSPEDVRAAASKPSLLRALRKVRAQARA